MNTNPPRGDVRFYTMGDSRYFLGAVALVNSLRIVGHHEPITFLDLGLTPRQRALLATECEMVDIERDPDDHPYTFQPYPYVLDASGICVIVDSDVIVTHHLGTVIDAARAGRIAAFPDRIERCVPEWEQIFELRKPLRSGMPYVNSGLVAFDADLHREFLGCWWQLCRELDVPVPATIDQPTAFADQDVLNALLMSDFADAQVAIESPSMVLGRSAFTETHVNGLKLLSCSQDGVTVAALHSVALPKPWSGAARFELRRDAYNQFLRRCLAADDLAIVPDPRDTPSRLRPGLRGMTSMHALLFAFRLRQLAYHVRVRLVGESPPHEGLAPGTPARSSSTAL